MLKKIKTTDVRLGMHVQSLCGNWLDHPFWKSKFLLTDPTELAQLQASAIEACWIDVSRGLDVAPAALTVPPDGAPPPPAAARPNAAADAGPKAATGFDEELRAAAALVRASRQAVMTLVGQARLGHAINIEQCLPVVGDITESVWRNPQALVSLARLKTHDDYSYMHSVAVCALMVALARRLGHDESSAREAGLAGLLHDMGKATMPLAILNKPGKLSDAEFLVIRSHPERGHQLLRTSLCASPMALDVCLHHHERPDGKGYPFGAGGDALSRAARMGAVCDVYDAITSNRPYKAGWDPAESIAKMADWTRSGQFDRVVYAAFVSSLGIYPTGSLVRLQSGRLAVVVEQNDGALMKPRVRVFYSTRSQLPVARELLDLNAPGCNDRIVGRESNADWKFSGLDELWAGAEVLARRR